MTVKLGCHSAIEAVAAGQLYRYRLTDADRHLARWLERVPDDPLALLAAGKLAELREQYSDAAIVFRRVLELDPSECDIAYLYSRQLRELGRTKDAVTAYQKALQCTGLKERPELHAQVAFEDLVCVSQALSRQVGPGTRLKFELVEPVGG